MRLCSELLNKHCLPHQVRKDSSSEFGLGQDIIKVLPLHASKDWRYPWLPWWAWATCPPRAETSARKHSCSM